MFLSNFQFVLNHSGMTLRVLGHSLVRSLVPSHRTLIHFLHTPRFCLRAPLRSFFCSLALHCSLCSRAQLRSFVCLLAHSRAHGKEVYIYELNASISCSFNPLWVEKKSKQIEGKESRLRNQRTGILRIFLLFLLTTNADAFLKFFN